MSHALESISLCDVFVRLSSHLDGMAGQIYDIEEALGYALSLTSGTEELPVTKLQSLDFVRQSLEDCALLLTVLCQDGQIPRAIIDEKKIVTKLRLDTTRTLIESNGDICFSDNSGDVDLF